MLPEHWRLLSTGPLPTAMYYEPLADTVLQARTNLHFSFQPDFMTRRDYLALLHLTQTKTPLFYIYSQTYVSLATSSLNVFNYIPSSMHVIHTDHLDPVFAPQSKLPRKISIMDDNIRYNSSDHKFRVAFMNRLFCKTTFESLFLKDEYIYLEMCNATLFPQLYFQWLSP